MKIKLLSNNAQMPTKADNGAAGYDLYVPQDFTVNPGRNIIPLDFAIELSSSAFNPATIFDPMIGYEATIRPRSGFSAKGVEGIGQDGKTRRFNADVKIGTIDQTYRGNVGVILKSDESEPFTILKGTRIAQMVISLCYMGPLAKATNLSETERGEGGFGHTGSGINK